jgi:hypothetical protein
MTQPPDEPAPGPTEDRPGEDLPLIELETLLNRPPSLRKRLAQLGLILLAALVALVILWGRGAPNRPAAPAVSEPTPTAFPPMLLIISNVNFGTVIVNGKQQVGAVPGYMLLPVHSRAYTITLDTPPFRPVTCSVRLADLKPSDPLSDGKHCVGYAASRYSPPGTPAFQIYLFLTPNDLPPDQQSQITGLLTRTLTLQQHTTVPVGSYFATRYNYYGATSQRASVPLRASATIAPFALHNPQIILPCVEFICPGSIPSESDYPLAGHQWAVIVTLALRWRFTTTSGSVVSDVLFQGDSPYTQIIATAHLFLSLDDAGAWTISQNVPVSDVASQLQDTFCNIGNTILQGAASPGPNGTITTLRDRGVEGCEWQTQVNSTEQGTFLWRFGVLLVADAKTHAAYPSLPIAPPQEIAALAQP